MAIDDSNGAGLGGSQCFPTIGSTNIVKDKCDIANKALPGYERASSVVSKKWHITLEQIKRCGLHMH